MIRSRNHRHGNWRCKAKSARDTCLACRNVVYRFHHTLDVPLEVIFAYLRSAQFSVKNSTHDVYVPRIWNQVYTSWIATSQTTFRLSAIYSMVADMLTK